MSCPVRVRVADGRTALLSGGIMAARPRGSVNWSSSAPLLQSEWLMAPHQGSKTSSSEALLGWVAIVDSP
ncbi:MAG: hypothetical protein JO006_00280 [Paucibacter sp.]|nr:hypothetical protein [Roseateles sp.]